MTILRSRAVAGQAVGLANAGVDRALKEWEGRIVMARAAGRQDGLAEAAARVAEAERRAAQAEAAAAARMAKQQGEFLARFEPVLASLSGASQQLEHLEKQLVQESEAEIVRLALAVAAAVLRCTVERDPAWMTALARRAIAEVPDRRAVVVRMHPSDAAALNERVAEVTARIPGLERIEVLADISLARGSCIVHPAHKFSCARRHTSEIALRDQRCIHQRTTNEALASAQPFDCACVKICSGGFRPG